MVPAARALKCTKLGCIQAVPYSCPPCMLSPLAFVSSLVSSSAHHAQMFDPSAVGKKKSLVATKKAATEQVKAWVMELLPEEVKAKVELVAVREFQCGDPKCAPIDTAIQIMFKETSKPPMQTGIPKEVHNLTREDVKEAVEDMVRAPTEARSKEASKVTRRSFTSDEGVSGRAASPE